MFNKKNLSVLLLCLALLFVSRTSFAEASAQGTTPISTSNAPDNTEEIHDIQKLLEVTHVKQLLSQMTEQMLKSFKQNVPEMPDSFWISLSTEFNTDELTQRIIPIYAKYFTDEDIKNLIQFYQSPLGQTMIAKMPLVMKEAMAEGQAWGQEVAQRVLKKLKDQKPKENAESK